MGEIQKTLPNYDNIKPVKVRRVISENTHNPGIIVQPFNYYTTKKKKKDSGFVLLPPEETMALTSYKSCFLPLGEGLAESTVN